jgi:uncharacterized protein Yka (UPF0111/DUF47 family)
MLQRLKAILGITPDARFERLFEEHIANTIQCASELRALFARIGDVQETAARIVQLEHHGDELTRQVHQWIDRVYITRFDKNDLGHLINELDSVIDKMREAVESEIAYPRSGSYDVAEKLTGVIQEMVGLVQTLVQQLLHARKPDIQHHVAAVKNKEEEADQLRHSTMQRLYAETDAKSFIAWRDVLGKLEQVTDHCQNVADVVSSMSRR